MQSAGDDRSRRDDGAGAGHGIAADIAPAERARLVARFGRPFAAGEALFREGEAAKEALLLQEGRVRILKRVRMVERSLMVVRPGDLFGESALLDATARNSTAVALTDGVALALSRETFRALLETHPSIAMRVIDQLAARVRDAEDQIEIMMLRDTQSKVVSALLKLARDGEAAQAELHITPVELSTRVGLDVDTVKRTVQRLREQGYVKITGEKVELPDVGALKKLYALLGTKEELRGDPAGIARAR
jgi:CRP/FNR family cyclic AMP-dependent transcriptional regulator